MKQKVFNDVRRVLHFNAPYYNREIYPETHLTDLDMDSLDKAAVTQELERLYSIEVSLSGKVMVSDVVNEILRKISEV